MPSCRIRMRKYFERCVKHQFRYLEQATRRVRLSRRELPLCPVFDETIGGTVGWQIILGGGALH